MNEYWYIIISYGPQFIQTSLALHNISFFLFQDI